MQKMTRNVVEDTPATVVPRFGYEEELLLNRQTGFNRKLVEGANACGCFHCGSRFTPGEIVEWMYEDGEEDTACCPYCGEDAVIVGTDELPLSTALLTLLYGHWFGEEFKARRAAATSVPCFSSWDDFQKKGIPFLYERDPSVEVAGDILLFRTDLTYEECMGGGREGADCPPVDAEEDEEEPFLYGKVDITVHLAPGGAFHWAELTDSEGHPLPYTPYGSDAQKLLAELAFRNGPHLKGLIKDGFRTDVLTLLEESSGRWGGALLPCAPSE